MLALRNLKFHFFINFLQSIFGWVKVKFKAEFAQMTLKFKEFLILECTVIKLKIFKYKLYFNGLIKFNQTSIKICWTCCSFPLHIHQFVQNSNVVWKPNYSMIGHFLTIWIPKVRYSDVRFLIFRCCSICIIGYHLFATNIVIKILCVWRAPNGLSEYTTMQQTRAGQNMQHWQNRKVN